MNKLVKYYKVILLLLICILNLFLLFNPKLLISYHMLYILLNMVIILWFIFIKIKIIELKEYIDISVISIHKELLLGKIKPIKAPLNLKDIREFIDAINKIILYLSKKNKTAQEFNSNVSHELKAPITELKTDLEYFLYYTPLDNNITEKIKYFIKKIDNLETITSQMLFVSNNNIDNLNNAMQRVLLNDIVYEAIEDKSNLLEQKNISLQIDINKAISLHGHRELLKHAISNILDNAIKYSSINQKIFIWVAS